MRECSNPCATVSAVLSPCPASLPQDDLVMLKQHPFSASCQLGCRKSEPLRRYAWTRGLCPVRAGVAPQHLEVAFVMVVS